MTGMTGYLFWGFLIVYGFIMFLLSPKKVTEAGFFRGDSNKGERPTEMMLMLSIFISWIFAKSVTNAANLGAQYGFVGGLAYATYWLCIPIAGFAIYRLRRKYQATGLVSFLNSNYGKAASVAFSAAILIRLFNEVWSNTSVVGGYYGKSGSREFIISAILFTVITLGYTVLGGLRSSIVTDVIQAIIFVFFVGWVITLILPKHNISEFVTSGSWTMQAGVDMLLVTILQLFSYPFHDPVLTDRGFIAEEKTMLRAFIVSGILGFISILIFSFIGIHAKLIGMEVSSNVPAALGKTLGVAGYFAMIVVMISAAGSTLDSTFASLGKLTGKDLPEMAGKPLKATTISGTMVIGLAPIFLLHGFVKPTKIGFHLSFWIGIILGVLLTVKMIPASWAIGSGKSALLLGVNFYGLILCTLGYVIPGLFAKRK